jgi:hypothetical protein
MIVNASRQQYGSLNQSDVKGDCDGGADGDRRRAGVRGRRAAKTVVAEGVKDAYRAVKAFLSGKYPQIDLTPSKRRLSQSPARTS